MQNKDRFRIVLVAGSLGVAILGLCLGTRGTARTMRAPEEPAKGGPTPLYFGAKLGCGSSRCHGRETETDEDLVCDCNEYTTWNKKDKHALAYKALLGDRSKDMGKALKYKESITQQDACLSCHSVIIKNDKDTDESFRPEEGVNCVICHGPYRDWVVQHGVAIEFKRWRKYTPEKKEKMFGMTDLWSPSKHAALCASCHIGEVKPKVSREDKFVTHEMYAAGHPPLPGFEAAMFADQMPKHWKYFREKPEKAKKILLYKGVDYERTKLILVGAAVSLRESMKLLSRQATKADKETLDLANFDCYACHHDLKSPSWRQARGYTGKPGRVPMRPWPSALVKLAVHQATENETEANTKYSEFDKRWHQLGSAFEDRPFGDPSKIAPVAEELAKWAHELASQLEKKPCNEADARRLLVKLPTLYASTTPDYDSARQIAWAFEVMYDELHPKGDKADPEVKKLLTALRKELKLDLPSGRNRNIVEELKDGLQRLNSYDPDKFREALRQLSALLKDK